MLKRPISCLAKRSNCILAITLLIFLSTGCAKKYNNINYYIPINYKGAIAIVFDVDSSSNHTVIAGDTLNYYIKGNPCFFTIKNSMPEEGLYKVKYFYYSTDTLIELKSNGNRRQIVNNGTVSINDGSKIVFESMYVSDSIRNNDSLYEEMEKYPDICW